MIERYNMEDVAKIWSEECKFSYYLQVEMALLESLERKNIAPTGTVQQFKNIKINLNRIHEIEKETHHDVIAFCSSIMEQVDTKASKYFHYGVTSSDIIDTAHSLMLRDSLLIIKKYINNVINELDQKIDENKNIICMGRSHGIFAEAMSLGQKFNSHREEFNRRLLELNLLIKGLTGKMTGAVGNYTVLNVEIEKQCLELLDLKRQTGPSQIIPRDQFAKIIQWGALLACAIERMATELRLLQHSDVNEIAEGFALKQKGSSTMPHKKNPISAENICGLARVIKSHQNIALENCNLWHERDISHSSAERMMLPDHFGLLAYTLNRSANTLRNLVINTEHIENKVRKSYQIYSSFLLHDLIRNTELTRDECYRIIQNSFFESHDIESLTEQLQQKCAHHKLEWNFGPLISFQTLKERYIEQFTSTLYQSDQPD